MDAMPSRDEVPGEFAPQSTSRGQLRWRCRRGMKELDVLLSRFVEEQFDQSSAADQAAFWRLLDSQDTTLYAYFLGSERPAAAELAALVERIAGTAGGRIPQAGA